MNDPDNEPSPNRLLSRLGMRKPTVNASAGAAARPVRGDRSGSLIEIILRHRKPERAARLLHEVALDERIDVAVQYAIDVADLLLRAVIFDQLIGMEHVAPDLATERDLLLGAANLVELGLLL